MNILRELIKSLLNLNRPKQPDNLNYFGQFQQFQISPTLIPLNIGLYNGLKRDIGDQIKSKQTFQKDLGNPGPILYRNPIIVNSDIKLHEHFYSEEDFTKLAHKVVFWGFRNIFDEYHHRDFECFSIIRTIKIISINIRKVMLWWITSMNW